MPGSAARPCPKVGRVRRWVILSIVLLVGAAVLAPLVWKARQAEHVVIAVTPAQGAFDETATRLAEHLRRGGYHVETVEIAESAEAVDLVQDPNSPVNTALMAMPLEDELAYPDVTNAGTFARMPVAIVVPGDSDAKDVRDLRGSRIQIGVHGSMGAETAELVLTPYGITADNSTFLSDAPDAALASLSDGTADAVVAILDPFESAGNAMLAHDADLRLISLPDAAGLAALTQYTFPTTIPAGGFSLTPLVPAEPVETVAMPASVIVNAELGGGPVYAIAQFLAVTYDRGSISGMPGEFPNFTDTQVTPNPIAKDYYANLVRPWAYQTLPSWVADSFVTIIVAISVLVIAASVYAIFFPDTYTAWAAVVRPARQRRAAERLAGALAEGRDLTPRERRKLHVLIEEHEREQRHHSHLQAMRAHLANDDDPLSA